MATTSRLMTADALYALPDDGAHRFELVRGEVIAVAPPGFGHGGRAFRIASRLGDFVEQHNLGEVVVESGFVLAHDPDTVRGPDVAFVAKHRLPPVERAERYFEGPPDLAVEIVSPNDTASDVLEKVREYVAAGTRLVWIVDRRTRSVMVYRSDGSAQLLTEADALSGEDVLPGFSLGVREILGAS